VDALADVVVIEQFKEINVGTIKENNVIRKANALIESSHSLDIMEQKLILLLASMVQPTDVDFKPYQFRVADIIEILGIKNQSKYTELKNLVSNLLGKTLLIKNESTELYINWLSSAEYISNSGMIELCFDPKLKPYLLGLKERYTSFQLKNIIRLTCVYSPRIYELLKQYEKLGERTISVEELRYYLRLDSNTYRLYADLKRFCILRPQKELKEKTDISFEFEEIKRGRRVYAIKFIIKPNVNQMALMQGAESEIAATKADDEQVANKLPFDKQELFDILTQSFGIHKVKAEELVVKYDRERILKNLEITENKLENGEIKNGVASFAIAAIEKDFRTYEPAIIEKVNKKKKEAQKDKYAHLYFS